MNVAMIVVGSIILAGLFAGVVYVMVRDLGWRDTLVGLAVVFTLTGVLLAAALMLGLGIDGLRR